MTHKGWFGTVFKTLHFLPNLQKGPKSYSITLHYPGKFTNDKNSSLLGRYRSFQRKGRVVNIGPYSKQFIFS